MHSYWNLIKFPYFADTIEREDRGERRLKRQSEKQGNFTNNSIVIPRQKLSTYSQLSDFYEYDYEILGLQVWRCMIHSWIYLASKDKKGEEI